MFQTKVVEKIKTHFLCSKTFFRKSYPWWDNVEKYATARQATDDNIIRRMRFACWITKVTDTHSQYVILISFPRQQWLRERTSMLVILRRVLFHYVTICLWLYQSHRTNKMIRTSLGIQTHTGLNFLIILISYAALKNFCSWIIIINRRITREDPRLAILCI
jgi:hypothetical protein